MRQLAHNGIDFRFCADVDALRRFIHNQDFRRIQKPFAQNHFLLIAAGQIDDLRPHGRRLNAKPVKYFLRDFIFGFFIDQRAAGQLIQHAKRQIVADGEHGNKSGFAPFFRQETQSLLDRVARRMDIHFFSFDKDLLFHAFINLSENRAERFASACANQTAEAQNFTFVQRKTDIVNDVLALDVRVRHAQVLHAKDFFALIHMNLGILIFNLAADHLLHQIVFGDVRNQIHRYESAVAHHRHAVGQTIDFIQLMRDKQRGHTRLFQLSNHVKQRFRFIVRQGGRRLVQHNDFRLFDHGAHDGQHLELTAVEHAGRRSGINMPHVNRFKNLPGIGIQLLPVNKRTISRKIADKQVFGNARHQNHVQFLIDHFNPASFSV